MNKNSACFPWNNYIPTIHVTVHAFLGTITSQQYTSHITYVKRYYCIKYHNFTEFPGVEILCKTHSFRRVSGNFSELFLRNFHAKKLGEISVFNTVYYIPCWQVSAQSQK